MNHRITSSARAQEMHDDDLVTVCSACKMACCWQGKLFCDDYRAAGTLDLPVSELRRLGHEHESYWRKQP